MIHDVLLPCVSKAILSDVRRCHCEYDRHMSGRCTSLTSFLMSTSGRRTSLTSFLMSTAGRRTSLTAYFAVDSLAVEIPQLPFGAASSSLNAFCMQHAQNGSGT